MTKIAVVKETQESETRVALTPAHAARLRVAGASVEIERGAGVAAGYPDEVYRQEGATVRNDRRALLSEADIILRVRKPANEEVDWLKRGALQVSFLDPFRERDLVRKLAGQGVSAISMELVPRITRAQKMDALSSQANLAGYVAVVLAANHLNKIFPMMMTAAGTIAPARVLVIGAGVAGLQAIATAKRLGARVEAYDTRPVVEEQVRSLGARFLKIDVGETGQTKEGYAKPLTAEQLEKQRQAMIRFCAEADVVITTAQVFGRRAPVLITAAMTAAMRPGSVVVDLAVESGGNVEGIVSGEIANREGVKLIGIANLPGLVPLDASQVYSTNLFALLTEFWDKERFVPNLEDEILRGCLLTHNGEIRRADLLEKQ